jgi:hypothetical protein
VLRTAAAAAAAAAAGMHVRLVNFTIELNNMTNSPAACVLTPIVKSCAIFWSLQNLFCWQTVTTQTVCYPHHCTTQALKTQDQGRSSSSSNRRGAGAAGGSQRAAYTLPHQQRCCCMSFSVVLHNKSTIMGTAFLGGALQALCCQECDNSQCCTMSQL